MDNDSLITIVNQIKMLEMQMDDNLDPDVYRDTMDSLQYDLKAKVDGCARYMSSNDAVITEMKNEIERLKTRITTFENRNTNMKKYIKYCLSSAGLKSLETDLFTFGIRKNSGGSLVLDVEEDQIPKEFLTEKVTYKVDKKALKEQVAKGNYSNIAHIEPSEDSLTIK